MAQFTDMEKEEFLRRMEMLEKETFSLRKEVKEMHNEMNIINGFISALTESRSIEDVTRQIETTAKLLTGSEDVTFYCMDSVNGKFFSENDGRDWAETEENEMLKSISDKQEIVLNGNTSYVPLVTSDSKTLGIVSADSVSDNEMLKRIFAKGGSFVNGVRPGLKTEYEHQGRITDELTKMYNRQGLNEYLESTVVKAVNDGMSVNMILSDIDHFKTINDTYGHNGGDAALLNVAEIIKQFTQGGADCCFRFGGDEMLTILITDTQEEAIGIADDICRSIAEKSNEIAVDGQAVRIPLTVSMGIHEMQSDIPLTKENVKKIFSAEFEQADQALYKAKETGRNKVVCTDVHNYMSYLADQTADIFIKAEGLENKQAIDDVLDMVIESMVNPANGLSDVVDALRAYAVQNSDVMPEMSAHADRIADNIVSFYRMNEEKTQEISPTDIQEEIPEETPDTEMENLFLEDVDHYAIQKPSGTTFAERLAEIKEWCKQAIEKAAEKEIDTPDRNKGAR